MWHVIYNCEPKLAYFNPNLNPNPMPHAYYFTLILALPLTLELELILPTKIKFLHFSLVYQSLQGCHIVPAKTHTRHRKPFQNAVLSGHLVA